MKQKSSSTSGSRDDEYWSLYSSIQEGWEKYIIQQQKDPIHHQQHNVHWYDEGNGTDSPEVWVPHVALPERKKTKEQLVEKLKVHRSQGLYIRQLA